MKYEVDTRFIFSGKFFIEAENREQAREYVDKYCGLVINGNVHSSLSAENADWDFTVHPDKVIGKIRRADMIGWIM